MSEPLANHRSNGRSGAQFRPETILEGCDDPCDRFSNFLGSQRALTVAEKHVQGQAPMSGRYLGSLVLVDQTEVFERGAGRGSYGVDEFGIRNLYAGDDGEVAGDGRLPEELMVSRQSFESLFTRLEVELEAIDAVRHPFKLDNFGVELAD